MMDAAKAVELAEVAIRNARQDKRWERRVPLYLDTLEQARLADGS